MFSFCSLSAQLLELISCTELTFVAGKGTLFTCFIVPLHKPQVFASFLFPYVRVTSQLLQCLL
jgi:hypothetical protein